MRKSISLLFVLLLSVSAFAQDDPKPSGKLTRVETKMVCMVNERNMGKEQIPVEIDGRIYYGCCEMCKKALAVDPTKRVAKDPVSGKQVDKSTAVIAAQENGQVFYFENEESLAKYNKQFEK